MKILLKIRAYSKLLRNISLVRTVYVNLATQRFSHALRLPILVGKCVRIRTLGSIDLVGPLKTGMLSLGVHHLTVDHNKNIFVLENYGQIVSGNKVIIRSGCKLFVGESGSLILGDDIQIGANAIIQVCKKINIDSTCRFSWNCQLLDSNIHFVKNLKSGKVSPREKEIHISSKCWIGNHAKIGKGITLNKGTIVAANSVVTKGPKNENTIMAGAPAVEIAEGFERIFNHKEEGEWIEFYNNKNKEG